jgi:hypothetical protein
MRNRNVAVLLAALGVAAVIGGAVALAAGPAPDLKYHAYAPGLSVAELLPTPTPTPRPDSYAGPVQSLYLASAGLGNSSPVEARDTTFQGGREVFQEPSGPAQIAWYSRFGHPGFAAHNSIFAAHINYIGYGNGPFANLTRATIGDALYVTMDNGTQYTYTVKSVDIVQLDSLDMDEVVFPVLDNHAERITLISCGGTFVPHANGVGGDYNSRVILVAERYVN